MGKNTDAVTGKMEIVNLPGGGYMIVLSEMPELETPQQSADWCLGRQMMLSGGASIVVRFSHAIEIKR